MSKTTNATGVKGRSLSGGKRFKVTLIVNDDVVEVTRNLTILSPVVRAEKMSEKIYAALVQSAIEEGASSIWLESENSTSLAKEKQRRIY